MSDKYDPDEKFTLWPLDPEDGLRRLLGTDDEDTIEPDDMDPDDS